MTFDPAIAFQAKALDEYDFVVDFSSLNSLEKKLKVNLYSIRILGEDIISQIIYDNTENNFQYFNLNNQNIPSSSPNYSELVSP